MAFIHFCDNINYQSVYQQGNDFYKRTFEYPSTDNSLFACENEKLEDVRKHCTILTAITQNKKVFNFFEKYPSANDFKTFLISNFFPLLNREKNIEVCISYFDEDQIFIDSLSIEPKNFKVIINNEEYGFTLYSIPINKENISIECFARGLLCELSDKNKLVFDLNTNAKFYLESKYFDDNVDVLGEIIECDIDVFKIIQKKLIEILD